MREVDNELELVEFWLRGEEMGLEAWGCGEGVKDVVGRGEEKKGWTDLAGFVLGDFMLGVFFAVFALAVGAAGFRYVDLETKTEG